MSVQGMEYQFPAFPLPLGEKLAGQAASYTTNDTPSMAHHRGVGYVTLSM